MTVGLPGAGIGGLFYLLAALAMPVRETWLTLTGRSSRARWGVVLQQLALAGSIVGGMWLTSLAVVAVALRLVPSAAGRAPGALPGAGGASAERIASWLRPAHGWTSFATLGALLALVWIASRLVARPAPARVDDAREARDARAARDARLLTPVGAMPALRRRVPTPWRTRAVREAE